MFKQVITTIVFGFGFIFYTFSQDTIFDGNDTIIKFYYENGNVSSMGPIKNGKPDGYWKNFYPDGTLKSEGGRKDHKLEGIWKFYNEEAKLKLSIEYKNDEKHGIRETVLEEEIIREHYVNGKKDGYTKYFSKDDDRLLKAVPFKNGVKHGLGRVYAKSGLVKEVTEYKNGRIISIDYINRKDNRGRKQGKWMYFYGNGNIKLEGRFINDKKHGFFKYYDKQGSLTKIEKYQNGILLPKAPEVVELDEKVSYYPDGKVKTIAHFLDEKPQGIWKEFDTLGNIEKTFIFDQGKVVSQGIIDEEGTQQGKWKYYYPDSKLLGKGQFKNGVRFGKWIFYHPNGNVEQVGYYNNKGQLHGKWDWFYESGHILKEEHYVNGKLDGLSVEYFEDGDTVAIGEYFENEPNGPWYIEYGDYFIKGSYFEGRRDGVWQSFYHDGTLHFKGKFVDGSPDGKHTYYWPNGKIKLQGNYVGYKKEGDWYRYNESGELVLTIQYKNGKEVKYENVELQFGNDQD